MEQKDNNNLFVMLGNIHKQLDTIEKSLKVYLNMTEASEYTGMSVPKIRRLIAARKIPYFKPTDAGSGRVYFKREDLDKFIEGGRVPSRFEVESAAATMMNGIV